jgi:hypothetical protein
LRTYTDGCSALHLPVWAADPRLLAANLAFCSFIVRIKLD